MKKMKKKILHLIIVAALMLIAGGVVFAYFQITIDSDVASVNKDLVVAQKEIERLQNNYEAISGRVRITSESNSELRIENGKLKGANSTLIDEVLRQQSEPAKISGFKAVSGNGYTFQVPQSWRVEEVEHETPKHYQNATTINFFKNGDEVASFRCPIKESGYGVGMELLEHQKRAIVIDEEIYQTKLELFTPQSLDFSLARIGFSALDSFDKSCEMYSGGDEQFDNFRKIFSSIYIDLNNPPQEIVREF